MSGWKSLALIVFLGLFIVASPGAAQYHVPQYATGGSVMYLVDGNTLSVSTIFDNYGTAYGITMDTDNKSLWFGQSSASGGIYKWDVGTMAVTTILADTINFNTPYDMIVNQDGDLVLTSRTSNSVYGLFKVSGGNVTTIATAPSAATTWYGGLEIDIDTGKYVLQAKNSPYALIAIDDAGVITTLGTGGNPRYSITQDYTTGTWYQGSFSSLFKLTTGSSTFVQVTLTGPTIGYFYAIACDRASAANPRMVGLHNNGAATSILNFIDLTTGAVTAKTVNQYIYNYEIEFCRGRNLCTVKTGTGKWDINLSFPGEAGKGYAVGMSLSGVRPGIILMDGRKINLAIDVLTALTVNNLIPSIFNPGTLTLDANGEAKAGLDVSSLGTLGGLRIWIEALLIDKGRIGTIADPVGITLP